MKLHSSIIEALNYRFSQDSVDSPTYIVSSRRRLTRHLKEADNMRRDVTVWNDPSILTIDGINGWVALLARSLLTDKGDLLINKKQAGLIWEDALMSMSVSDKELIGWDVFADESGTMKKRFVAQAQAAWRLVHLYRVEFVAKNFSKERMSRFFYKWSQVYCDICKEKGLVDENMALIRVCAALFEGRIIPPSSLWVGFDETYPAYEELFDILHKQTSFNTTKVRNAFIMDEANTAKNFCAQLSLTKFENEREELYRLAHAVNLAHQDNPDELIGVVIPGMERDWHNIRRVFTAAFTQNSNKPSAEKNRFMEEDNLPFDMSWGEKLSEYALVGDALRMLSIEPLHMSPIDLADLFDSPYLAGYDEEGEARAHLRQKFYNLNSYSLQVSLQKEIEKPASQYINNHDRIFGNTPILKKNLQKYLKVKDAFVETASPQHWAKVFGSQIYSLGWGDIKWSRLEKQLWDQWEKMLDQLYAAGNILTSCSRARALSFLIDNADGIFQASPAVTGVRLLGIGQVESLMFDRLFACRMTDTCLPSHVTNFFIPYELGRAAKMKWCGLEQRWREEERTINYLRSMAPTIHFSFSARSEDEEKIAHSLLTDIPLEDSNANIFAATTQYSTDKEIEPDIPMEEIIDEKAPSLGNEENPKNLVNIIKSQSSCPFQAFVRHRLKLSFPQAPQEEVSAMNRGSMLHNNLRNIWTKLETHSKLCTLQEQGIEQLSESISSKTIQENIRGVVFLRDEMTAELEKKYLVELTKKLLYNDKEREVSFKVVGLEKNVKINFKGREYQLIVDRIDELVTENTNNNPATSLLSQVLIDYKSGNTVYSIRDMSEKRPREPQIIIYSLANKSLNSFGFITLNLKDGFVAKGLCMDNAVADGLFYSQEATISQEYLEMMQQNIKNIYDSFEQGDARVDPLDMSICRHCKYDSLCRIQEITQITNNV